MQAWLKSRLRQRKVGANYIPTLDGLRAVAILLVIASHTLDRYQYPTIVSLGHVGVAIFFALSGYLITSRLVEEYRVTGRISLRNFYIRRAFRILPPVLFYLTTLWALSWLGIVICSWHAIQSALFLYANYADLDGAGWRVGHFWSLSVEEHFYLLWPTLLIVFGVRKGWRTAAMLAIAISLWRILDDRFNIIAQIFNDPFLAHRSNRTDLIADALLWGCCLSFWLRPPLRESLSPGRSTALAIAAVGSIVGILFWNVNHMYIPLNLLPTVLLAAIIAAPNAAIGRILEHPVLRFIGRLSYSLYIWQQLFLGGPGPTLSHPVALLAIFACALFSYEVIEQPCIQLGSRLCRKVLESGQKSVALPQTSKASFGME